MNKILFFCMMLLASTTYAQERYVGLSRDSIINIHKANFETVTDNDTALVVKHKRDGTDWRYFRFDASKMCTLCAKEVMYFNDFTDLEKKLKATKYKNAGEAEYDFAVRKSKGTLYTKGKENYVLMYDAINPNMSASTRAVVYYKTR